MSQHDTHTAITDMLIFWNYGAVKQALVEQAQQGSWGVVSMKDDWKQIFPA